MNIKTPDKCAKKNCSGPLPITTPNQQWLSYLQIREDRPRQATLQKVNDEQCHSVTERWRHVENVARRIAPHTISTRTC